MDTASRSAGDLEIIPVPLGQAIVAAADSATAAIWLDQELLAADIEAHVQPADALANLGALPATPA